MIDGYAAAMDNWNENIHLMEKPKVLHLTLVKRWFEMIARGDKLEEYRSLNLFFANRFIKPPYGVSYEDYYPEEMIHEIKKFPKDWKENIEFYRGKIQSWDIVSFRNGYHPHNPLMTLEFKGIEIGVGNPEWGGDPVNPQFIIKLGKILSIKNYKP